MRHREKSHGGVDWLTLDRARSRVCGFISEELDRTGLFLEDNI